MADIRIKDLTTEVSSTATGDFFVIDGTTGTRKTPAFNPTFGGNATVTGTLTVTGNTTLSGNLDVASGISTGTAQLQIGNGRTGSGYAYVDLVGDTTYSDYGFRIIRNNGGANTSSELAHRGTGDFALVANDAAPIKFYTNGVTAATIAATTGNTTIHSTSASTSTSSGALVVGNGTSGGLGVGGAIFAGQSVSVVQSLADNNGFRVINTNTAGLPGLYIEGDGGEYALIRRNNSTAGNPRRVEYIATGSGANHYFNTNTIVGATTASTSTSSGALVVSGGVGVAKRIHSGEGLTTGGDNETHITFVRNGTVSIGPDNTATPALVVSSAIKTGAPSGGTAANWKLGTVATVSPTSPNRTIEVDIGGTIYYIHAKTTNN